MIQYQHESHYLLAWLFTKGQEKDVSLKSFASIFNTCLIVCISLYGFYFLQLSHGSSDISADVPLPIFFWLKRKQQLLWKQRSCSSKLWRLERAVTGAVSNCSIMVPSMKPNTVSFCGRNSCSKKGEILVVVAYLFYLSEWCTRYFMLATIWP